MISEYNSAPYHIKNLTQIFAKELSIFGFIVSSLLPKYEELFYEEMAKLVASGHIQFREDRSYGLEHAGQAILDVQKGRNNGKKVIVVAEDEPPKEGEL